MAEQSKTKIPPYLIKKAKDKRADTQMKMDQARNRIEPQYHDFLVMLPQNEKLNDNEYDVKGEVENLGVYSYSSGTYMSIDIPYVTVDGRIQMARDEHRAKEMKLNIHPPILETYGDTTVLSVTVDSELYGTATGTIEVGKPGAPGKSNPVDKKNPISNAQTSAIGRALGFLGYGLIGTGVIASEGEMEQASESLGDPITTPESTTTPSSKGDKPEAQRIQVMQLPKFNYDGSSTTQILLVTKQQATVIFPKEQNLFAQSLKINDVIHVTGWLNEEKMKLTVAKYSTSSIEQAS